MTVIEYRAAGGPEVIRLAQRDLPEVGAGQVLIKVAAAGVNRPDILQRIGVYPPAAGVTDVPGLEVSGVITRVAEDVVWPQVGDEVCALVAGGGYASHCLAPAAQCLPTPEGVTLEDAASLPETYFTVWTNLFEDGQLEAGQSVLIHGGAGGIGTTAILLAKSFGARVAVTASGGDRRAQCHKLGADLAVDYTAEDFVSAVKAWSPAGVDVVLDMVGGDYVDRNLSCMAPRGRHVSIAFLRGVQAEVNLFSVMMKRLTLTGSTLRSRSAPEKSRLTAQVRAHVWPRFKDGGLHPVICTRLPLAQAGQAHEMLERSQQFGKVLLIP
jgi:NADPH2:quinone reductase